VWAHVSVTILRRLPRLLAIAAGTVVLLVGCGGSAGGGVEGTAAIWITRDRGTEVLFEGDVPAGLTVMQALDRVADVDTRYGGRFVQAIDGIEGSLTGGEDWFYFVNGVAADRSAVEYRLREGEIAWWDHRSWRGADEVRVVVGSFPEPFLHGYGGDRRRAIVTYDRPGQRASALAVARLLEGRVVGPAERIRCCPNTFHLASGRACFEAEADSAQGPYRFVFAGDARALVRNPARFRFRFEGSPCA
jgi:hypothetical protein